jgi:hypothetical protein
MLLNILKFFGILLGIIILLLISGYIFLISDMYGEYILNKHKNNLEYNNYASNGKTEHVYYAFKYNNKKDLIFKNYNFYIEEGGNHFFYVLRFKDEIKKILLFLNLDDKKIKYIPSTAVKKEEMEILNFLIVKNDLFFE